MRFQGRNGSKEKLRKVVRETPAWLDHVHPSSRMDGQTSQPSKPDAAQSCGLETSRMQDSFSSRRQDMEHTVRLLSRGGDNPAGKTRLGGIDGSQPRKELPQRQRGKGSAELEQAFVCFARSTEGVDVTKAAWRSSEKLPSHSLGFHFPGLQPLV